jgi:hypothetical protein
MPAPPTASGRGKTPGRAPSGGEASADESGWIPWFAENRLFILGWARKSPDGPVYGVELELMTLLSRILLDLPRMSGTGTAWALVDGTGQILHQAGDFPVDGKGSPAVRMPLSHHLPHWEMQAWTDGSRTGDGMGFFIVSALLLVIFVTAILLGGWILTLQAGRDRRDAARKTSFVSSVSHELKTPLTTIRMYAELLLSGRVGEGKKDHYLSVIVSESQRLTRLVNNVLDFGRLEQGRKRYRPEVFDLRAPVESLVEAHAVRIRSAGMEPVLRAPGQPVQVFMDRDALEQVFLNLVDNAVKYAAAGKVLTVALVPPARGFADLRVEDRGPGIPREHREAIFDTFHRVDDSLTSGQPGSGLGLSIARRMMRDLGGDLVFEPLAGGGSCFTARIPSHDPKDHTGR